MGDWAPGYHDVPIGTLVNVVTNLEMRERPQVRPDPPGVRAHLRRVEHPSCAWYRALYHRVGDAYLWFSRLELDDTALRAVLDDPRVEVYALEDDGSDEGLLELDFRVTGACELTYLGLTATMIGTGTGRWLMNRALEIAWSHPVERVWLHTCTLDHPDAIAFYLRSGFTPFKRQIEVVPDPRVRGLVPRDAAPNVPII